MEAYLPPAPLSDAEEPTTSETMSVSPGIPHPEQVQEMMETIEQFQQTIDRRKEALDSLSVQQN